MRFQPTASAICFVLCLGCSLISHGQNPEVTLRVNKVTPYPDENRFLMYRIEFIVRNDSSRPVYVLSEGPAGKEKIIVEYSRKIFDTYVLDVGPNRHSEKYAKARELLPGEEFVFRGTLRGFVWQGDPEQGVPVSGQIQAKVLYRKQRGTSDEDSLSAYRTAFRAKVFFTVNWPSEVVCSFARYPALDGKCPQFIKREIDAGSK